MHTSPQTTNRSSAVDCFNLGTLANGWQFHRQMAHAGLVSSSGSTWGRRHDKTADQTLLAMNRVVAQASLDDPEDLTAVVRAAGRDWRDLAETEEYFSDQAQRVVEDFEQTAGRYSSAKFLRSWLNDDIIPIARGMRRGLRRALPRSLRPAFDLGVLFDQGWRRLDAYAFVRQQTGRPILMPYQGGWSAWGPLGPLPDKLRPVVEQITAERADMPIDEVEGELDFSGEEGRDVDQEDCVAPYDVPPGALAPETGWFSSIREQCRKYGLKAAAGCVSELQKACRAALRGECFREEWLLTLVEFRDRLLVELRVAAAAAAWPWRNGERDFWLYEQWVAGVAPIKLPQALMEKIRLGYDWPPIESTQIFAAVTRVASHVGDERFAKRKRGRPKKAR